MSETPISDAEYWKQVAEMYRLRAEELELNLVRLQRRVLGLPLYHPDAELER